MVGQAGEHGLRDTVAGVGHGGGRDGPEQGEDRDHDERRQHADGEEVAGLDHQRQPEAEDDEAQVEEQAELAHQHQVDDHDGERDGHAERHGLRPGSTPSVHNEPGGALVWLTRSP